jgi:hypothetical protein
LVPGNRHFVFRGLLAAMLGRRGEGEWAGIGKKCAEIDWNRFKLAAGNKAASLACSKAGGGGQSGRD